MVRAFLRLIEQERLTSVVQAFHRAHLAPAQSMRPVQNEPNIDPSTKTATSEMMTPTITVITMSK